MWTALIEVDFSGTFIVLIPKVFSNLDLVKKYFLDHINSEKFSGNIILVEIDGENQEPDFLLTFQSVRINKLGRTFWPSETPHKYKVIHNPFYTSD